MLTKLRWRLAPLVGAGVPSAIRPIVIGGCGSSGTTLLRQMLDRHPAIFCGPESTLFLKRTSSDADLAERFGFLPAQVARWRAESRSKAEFIERFQAACLARSGKQVWAEKTPENIRHFPEIARQFPAARLVHVIRDGRDVACSLRDADWMQLETITGGEGRDSPEALEACVRYWSDRVRFGRRLAGQANYHEVRYEALVADPEAALRGLMAFAGLDWDPRMLSADAAASTRDGRPIYGRSVGRWRGDLSGHEAEIVDRVAGPLLAELGYAPDAAWLAPLPRTTLGPRSAAVASASRASPRQAPGFKGLVKAMRRDAVALGLLLWDGAAPGPRLIGAFVAAYAAAPVDLIPDRRPGIGLLDDLLVALAALPLIFRLAPAALLRRRRIEAARFLSRRVWRVAAGRLRLGERAARLWGRLTGAGKAPGYVVDRDLRFVTVSPGALAAWGKRPEEVLGRRILEVFPGQPGEPYKAHLKALEEARPQRLTTMSRVFGRPIALDIRPLSDGLRVQFDLAA